MNFICLNKFYNTRILTHEVERVSIKYRNEIGKILHGKDVINHKDYQICKQFLNKWLTDDYFSLQDTSYYLDNYQSFYKKLGNCYFYPSYCFQFVLKKKIKTNTLIDTRDYCYHGTSVNLIKKIVNEGLRSPNGKDVNIRNGSYKGKAIYTTKIPEHAQIFADPFQWKGKYFQTFFLVRQDISKVTWTGMVDIASTYAKQIYHNSECQYMTNIEMLHSNLLNVREVQMGTADEKSLSIEAVIVKLHDNHPMKGQYKLISKMIQKLNS